MLYFLDIDVDLNYLFPYPHDIFRTFMMQEIFVIQQFHVIIYPMETESSL